MVLSSVEKLAESIGFDIAHSNDEIQANLINGFCRGLNCAMDDQSKETQICYMVDRLSPETESILRTILAFLDLRSDSKTKINSGGL